MASRAIASGTISFGLVSIPVKLYTAVSPQNVSFNQLHTKCGGRIKQQLYCPVDNEVVERSDIVKGYEYAKNQYVRFSPEEMKALEAAKSDTIEITEFVPLASVDLIHVEKTYYLGPDKGGNKAYQLLSTAMEDTKRVAVGRYWTHGKEQLVLIRPYQEGLLLHQLFYADEVKDFGEIGVGDKVNIKTDEIELAERLIEQLTQKDFQPSKYRDEFRDRVLGAVEKKVAGQEITLAPEQPTAQIIDLFEALKASLKQAPAPANAVLPRRAKPPRKALPKEGPARASKKKSSA